MAELELLNELFILSVDPLAATDEADADVTDEAGDTFVFSGKTTAAAVDCVLFVGDNDDATAAGLSAGGLSIFLLAAADRLTGVTCLSAAADLPPPAAVDSMMLCMSTESLNCGRTTVGFSVLVVWVFESERLEVGLPRIEVGWPRLEVTGLRVSEVASLRDSPPVRQGPT